MLVYTFIIIEVSNIQVLAYNLLDKPKFFHDELAGAGRAHKWSKPAPLRSVPAKFPRLSQQPARNVRAH